MKQLKILILILLICMLSISSTIGHPTPLIPDTDMDTAKYVFTESQVKKMNMIFEENSTLRKNIESFQISDSLNKARLNSSELMLINCSKMNDAKDAQLKKFESTPFTTTAFDTRKWYELPLATTVGVVVGIVVGVMFINK